MFTWVISCKRHIERLDHLEVEEAKKIELMLSRVSRVLKREWGAGHVYSFVMGIKSLCERLRAALAREG